MAKGLAQSNLLAKYFTAGLLKSDWKEIEKNHIFEKKIRSCLPINYADRIFTKLKLDRIFHKSDWYTLRDTIFDLWVAKELKESKTNKNKLPNVFVGWANASLETLKFCLKNEIQTVLECGSKHILEQKQILESEFTKHGLPPIFISEQNVQRMLKEYEIADQIAVPSTVVAQSFVKRGISKSKLIKIPYGSNALSSQTQRQKIPYAGVTRFLFAGQVSLQKGFYYLAQAWKENFANNPNACLTVVGEVNPECSDMAMELELHCKNVKIIGPAPYDQMPQFYANADVFVLPSLQEGMAMVIGEAACAGLAIICTPSCGWGDFLINEIGCLEVPEASAEGLAQVMERITSEKDLREAMVAKSIFVGSKLSWEHYTEVKLKHLTNLPN